MHHVVEAACKQPWLKSSIYLRLSQLDEVKEHFSQTEILEIFKRKLFGQHSSSN